MRRWMSPERDVVGGEQRPAPPQKQRESRALLARPPRLRLRQRRDAHAPGPLLTDVVPTKPRGRVPKKLGGRRRRRWVEGDEARLSQEAGFASVESWVDAAAGRPPKPASAFACLRSRARAPAEDAAP